jgi:AraC-like DNA-binding protein
VNGLTITNKHTPSVISISGAKTWVDGNNQDGVRPESITINLLADGKVIKTITVTVENEWAWSFTDLPKYRDQGVEIVYAITENAVEDYSTVFNNGTYPRPKDSLRDRKNDLTADLGLKTIAQKLNVNSSYLSTLFRTECGCTLTEYVTRERIDRGIYLLQRTEKSVQEIAAECGIQDANYFIKLFKKLTGLTPGRYREQMGTYK